MEMPEGWKDLYCPMDMSKSSAVMLTPLEARKICALIKEMAEALNDMVTACKQGYGRDINKMEKALKKFNNWK